MSDENGNVFSKWADEIRNELHDQDKRIVRIETTMKVLAGVITFLFTSGVIALILKLIQKL